MNSACQLTFLCDIPQIRVAASPSLASVWLPAQAEPLRLDLSGPSKVPDPPLTSMAIISMQPAVARGTFLPVAPTNSRCSAHAWPMPDVAPVIKTNLGDGANRIADARQCLHWAKKL